MDDADTLSAAYVPLDVSESVVRAAGDVLSEDYPGLAVHGVVGDFERHLDRLHTRDERRAAHRRAARRHDWQLPPGTRRRLLRSIARTLGPDDRFLLGNRPRSRIRR